jgi:hypothetical protein
MPYETKGKCVYKKGTDEKVGCTKGSIKKYMAALHANANESLDWRGSLRKIIEEEFQQVLKEISHQRK